MEQVSTIVTADDFLAYDWPAYDFESRTASLFPLLFCHFFKAYLSNFLDFLGALPPKNWNDEGYRASLKGALAALTLPPLEVSRGMKVDQLAYTSLLLSYTAKLALPFSKRERHRIGISTLKTL